MTANPHKTRLTHWRALCEIDAGSCDGLTYDEIKQRWPEEFEARQRDKFRYRYPRGESYLDIIERLEPVIFELERCQFPVVLIGHQAVLRCVYAYFYGDKNPQMSDIPYTPIPLHTVALSLSFSLSFSFFLYVYIPDAASFLILESFIYSILLCLFCYKNKTNICMYLLSLLFTTLY